MSQHATVLFDLPGPKARARYRIIAVVGTLLLALAVFGFLYGMRSQIAPANWAPLFEPVAWTAYLLPGIRATLTAAALSVVLASVLGFILGMGRLSHITVLNWAASAFVEFFRSVPVLLMMIFSYYLYRDLKLVPPDQLALAGVVTGLTMYNACVMAELIRSGVNSLPHGQREAGYAIGLTRTQTLVLVLVPQAITAMLPSLVSQLVVILKDTTLGFIITYSDLLRNGMDFSAWKGNLIPTLMLVALLYIAMNLTLSRLAIWLRRRVSRRLDRTPELVRGDLATEPDPDARLYADPLELDEARADTYEGRRRHYYAPEELEHEERRRARRGER